MARKIPDVWLDDFGQAANNIEWVLGEVDVAIKWAEDQAKTVGKWTWADMQRYEALVRRLRSIGDEIAEAESLMAPIYEWVMWNDASAEENLALPLPEEEAERVRGEIAETLDGLIDHLTAASKIAKKVIARINAIVGRGEAPGAEENETGGDR